MKKRTTKVAIYLAVLLASPAINTSVTAQCPNDMSHYASQLQTEELRETLISVDEWIELAGGLDRAIILTRSQLKLNEDYLEDLRENTSPRDIIPEEYENLIILWEEGIFLYEKYLEAMECRKE